jgi:hypothetical protein
MYQLLYYSEIECVCLVYVNLIFDDAKEMHKYRKIKFYFSTKSILCLNVFLCGTWETCSKADIHSEDIFKRKFPMIILCIFMVISLGIL